MRTIFCHKLQQEAPGLERLPYPGPLGQRIFDTISAQVWQGWMKHQTLLINENRLNACDPSARRFIETEMEKYCFGDGSETPQGFTPVTTPTLPS